MSERDSLTGLYNHSLTFKKTEELINLIGKEYESVTVGLIDIDDFKVVNDTYGHQKGDEVLVRFGQLLLSFKMYNSIVGRYGGDEFVVALPNLKRIDIKDRFRNLGKEMDKLKEELGVEITFSAGIAIYQKGDSAKDLIYKADIKMYESKRNGKNQLTIWENEIKWE